MASTRAAPTAEDHYITIRDMSKRKFTIFGKIFPGPHDATGVDGNRTHRGPRKRLPNGFEGRGAHQAHGHSPSRLYRSSRGESRGENGESVRILSRSRAWT